MLVEDKAATPGPQSTAAGPPSLPQVPPLGSPLSPVAGFVTGAAPAAGQFAAAPAHRRAKKGRPRVQEPTDHDDTADDEDPTKTVSGVSESERAPVDAGPDSNPDTLQTPLAARLDPENPPGPPAGTPQQDGR
jgi:hypothetical protein